MLSKEKRKKLSEAEKHVSTGTAHNKQLISIQADTILSIDDLEKEVSKLRKTIVSLNDENNKLQRTVAWLTVVTVGLAVVQVIKIFI